MSSQDSISSYYSDEDNYWFSDETRSVYSSDRDGDDSDDEDDYIVSRFRPKQTISSPLNLTMTVIEIPPKGDDGWGSALRETKEMIPPSPSLPSPSSPIKIPTEQKKSAWKPIDTTVQPPRDPWAFLEKPRPVSRPVPNPSRSSRPVSLLSSSPNASRSSRPVSLLNPHPTPRTEFAEYNKLCKYKDSCRMHRDGNCTMVHSLRDWKPKICRFNTTCSKKTTCGYHHSDVPLREYLSVMIKKKDTLYSKNAHLYQHYL